MPIGHVDFYPNGGSNQPGCDKKVESFMENEHSFFGGFQKLVGCNHVRSIQLFIEAMTSTCPFLSIRCENFEKFQMGECFNCNQNGNHCIQFGMNSIKDYHRLYRNNMLIHSQSIVTYFMTGGSPPYCRTHFKITVKISDSQESTLHGGEVGMLWFKVKGDKGETEKVALADEAM